MLELSPLNARTFPHFLGLLQSRGDAPESYYRWKYLDQPYRNRNVGFVAYLDKEPVGCVGIINRIYCDSNGSEHEATWFADWFVSTVARGKRVGEALMREVQKTAAYNFGIPGPVNAQKVCKRAGYRAVQGFVQYALYIRPFRCSYKRFAGSVGKKILRGIRSFLMSMPIQFNLFTTKNLDDFYFDFPNQQPWSIQPPSKTASGAYLKRTSDFSRWFNQMPISTDRLWWKIENSELYVLGYTETDYWGLKRTIIMDIQTSHLAESLWKIAATLSKVGVDWITFCYFDEKLSLKYWSKSALPLHVSISSRLDDLHLTDIDKDSSWRSFLFAL